MPYIKQEDRQYYDLLANLPNGSVPVSAGELQYCFALLLKQFIGQGYNYQRLNDALGALEGAKLEFYRRVVAPYEDTKITENGDIY